MADHAPTGPGYEGVIDLGARRALKDGGGGGTFDSMEAKVARLETQMENVATILGDLKADVRELRSDARTDFRLLFGAIIFTALGLAGLMAKGFKWL